jgi:hypothetical protein
VSGHGQAKTKQPGGTVKLVTLGLATIRRPGQKSMYEQVDPIVRIPDGPDVRDYLKQIERFNSRSKLPLAEVYAGNVSWKNGRRKAGDIVVISGNNRRKAECIKASIDAGFNVFCDKPMCIDAKGFALLEQSFALAESKGLLLYDIMTERYNVTCILQKLLVLDKDLFGELQAGSVDNPGVVKESVHHFFKNVAVQSGGPAGISIPPSRAKVWWM